MNQALDVNECTQVRALPCHAGKHCIKWEELALSKQMRKKEVTVECTNMTIGTFNVK